MNLLKYIGMDVHKATTVITVLNAQGKVVQETIIETKAEAILDFIKGQRGTLQVAFEEGTQAAWLYDLIQPYVASVVVCDPQYRKTISISKPALQSGTRLKKRISANSQIFCTQSTPNDSKIAA